MSVLKSAPTLAVSLGTSAFFKTYKAIWHSTEFADLALVLAGVVIGAMFEKERAKRRHPKRAKSAA